jgi:RimJ/RimL family protein N-acetyltransferase
MIPGERIELHALEPGHLENANAWINDPDSRKYLSFYIPQPKNSTKKWYESMSGDPSNYVFAIQTKRGMHIGNIGLHGIDWKNRHGELGIVIGEKRYLDRGYGADAVHTLVRFAFREMNLNRVYLKVYAYNLRAVRCYEKCGFKREGVLRDAMFHGAKYYDALMMGILRKEFESAEKKKCVTK